MKLTSHFTLAELTVTSQPFDNTPSEDTLIILTETARRLETVRMLLEGAAIHVSSGYRSIAVNKAVGGSSKSAHLLGYAVDFTTKEHTPLEICRIIAASTIKFDQLIYEGTWVHISFDPKERMDILTADFSSGKAKYIRGL
jgi:hypothetical protein